MRIEGYCPVCSKETRFTANDPWLRDHLLCERCGSNPRERALFKMLNRLRPNWRDLTIHESSPGGSGASQILQSECPGYIPTHYFPDTFGGQFKNGFRCENIEAQTFVDQSFDLVLTLDVFEHIFNPVAATAEIYRTLKPGGLFILTTPIYKDILQTRQVAEIRDGKVIHLEPPEYHGNPADPEGGALVTYRYGYDLHEFLAQWAPFGVEITRFSDRISGILGEFTEVIVCQK